MWLVEAAMGYKLCAVLSVMSLWTLACSGDDGEGGGGGGSGGTGGGASGSAGKGSGGVGGAGGSAGVATGGSAGGGNPSGVAAHICSEEIECGYQLADQATCVELFELFFDAAQLQACDACVSAEDCDTQQDVCLEICTI